VRAQLEQAFVQSLTVQNKTILAHAGVRPLGEGSAALDALIRRELAQWRTLVQEAHITAN
jgi:tripartite-type tricarboxylate transporter receptor subunit TctC